MQENSKFLGRIRELDHIAAQSRRDSVICTMLLDQVGQMYDDLSGF